MNSWIAPNIDLLPDFVIGGAMKSGTSTIHRILMQHPEVFIPDKEIGFFDIDNILEHPDFNFFAENKWVFQSMERDPKVMWDWYQKKFEGRESFLKGEDSTTYLASQLAAKRIAEQKKDIKLIFVLRQPSLRAYSNYNHLLRTGRATYSFEDSIKYAPFPIINRSLYKEQIEVYYKYIPKSRIKIIVFEDFVFNPKSHIKELCEFLEINHDLLPQDVFRTHANKTVTPKNIKLQIQKNYMLRNLANSRYSNDLPFKSNYEIVNRSLLVRAMNKLHSKLNPLVAMSPPEINPETKFFLDTYFYNQLQGLDELVGKEILSKWFDKC